MEQFATLPNGGGTVHFVFTKREIGLTATHLERNYNRAMRNIIRQGKDGGTDDGRKQKIVERLQKKLVAKKQ